MPPLQVKDCPQDVYEKLREYAQRENRSMAQQTLTILQEHLGLREAPSASETQITHAERDAEIRGLSSYAQQHSSSYLHDDAGVDYLTRYQETLKRIDALPSVPVSKTRPRADVLLAEIREEEAR